MEIFELNPMNINGILKQHKQTKKTKQFLMLYRYKSSTRSTNIFQSEEYVILLKEVKSKVHGCLLLQLLGPRLRAVSVVFPFEGSAGNKAEHLGVAETNRTLTLVEQLRFVDLRTEIKLHVRNIAYCCFLVFFFLLSVHVCVAPLGYFSH